MNKDSFLNEVIRLDGDNFTHNMWGGDWIPRLKGITTPPVPVGESWEFSCHERHPSLVSRPDGTKIPLPQLIAQYPREILGEKVADLAGNKAPFLLKLIDARDDLSLQVHPNDDYARQHENDSGKSEAWLVLDVGQEKEEGYIYLGFAAGTTEWNQAPISLKEKFSHAIQEAKEEGPSDDLRVKHATAEKILPFLNKIRVKPGDTFNLTAGTIHATGKGIRMCEIQQTSDLTYRVWDWNRLDPEMKAKGKKQFRPLHIEKAMDVIDFRPHPPTFFHLPKKILPSRGKGNYSEENLIRNKKGKFALNRIQLSGTGSTLDLDLDGNFSVLTTLKGKARINGDDLISQGTTVLLPATIRRAQIMAESDETDILRSHVPLD